MEGRHPNVISCLIYSHHPVDVAVYGQSLLLFQDAPVTHTTLARTMSLPVQILCSTLPSVFFFFAPPLLSIRTGKQVSSHGLFWQFVTIPFFFPRERSSLIYVLLL